MWPFEEEERAIRSGWSMAMLLLMPFFILVKIFGFLLSANQSKQEQQASGRWIFPPPPPRKGQTNRPPPSSPIPQADPLEEHRHRLGVSKGDSQEDVKKRYRFMSHAFHPDKFPQPQKPKAEEEFKKINESYQILTDPQAQARLREKKQESSTEPPDVKRPPSKPKYW